MLSLKHPILILSVEIWLGLLLLQYSTCDDVVTSSTSIPDASNGSNTTENVNATEAPDTTNSDNIERNFTEDDCKKTDLSHRPQESAACDIWKEYDSFKYEADEKKDCNAEGTNDAIKFMKTFVFPHPWHDHLSILWKHRMNMHRFRKFMKLEGFLINPGTIKFRLHQEKTMKLFCGPEKLELAKKNNNDKGYKWTVIGTKNDKEWNKDASDLRRQVFKAAHSHLYIQRYKCENKNTKCAHYIYVITRPYPTVSKHIQIYEGRSGELVCEVPNCLYDDSKPGCTDFTPNKPPLFYPPIEFYFIFPRHIELEVRTTADLTSGHIKPNEFPKTKIVFNKKDTRTFVVLEKDKVNPNNSRNQTVTFYTKAKVQFDEVLKEKHDGEYECVFVDYNGVTSSSPPPDPRKGEKPIKKDGVRKVHVRQWYWLFIAITIVCIIPLFSTMIECCCKRRMEYDDGTRYTEEELAFNDKVKSQGAKTAIKAAPDASTMNVDKEQASTAQVSKASSRNTLAAKDS